MLNEDLRKSILQAAIQGKLVDQHHSDGSVDELIKEITTERDRLIKEKVIKKTKGLALISEEEIPFDIPDSWRWIRLGDVIQIGENLNIHTKLNPDDMINYIDIDAIDNQRQVIKGFRQEPVKKLSSRARRVLKKGMIIYSLVRPYLKNMAFVEYDMENLIGTTGLIAFNTYKGVDEKYIFYLLMTPYVIDLFNKCMTSFNSPSINLTDFNGLLIPMPPYKEQKRIVEKIEEVMKEIDEYEVTEKELHTLKQSFPVDLKKSLLQAAIQGNLVEQCDSDGNVDELIDAINTERERLIKEKVIKKSKALEPISEEEIPFDIPDNWRWIRLGELGNIVGGGTPKTTIPEYWSESNEGVSWLTPADLSGNEKMFVNHGKRFISTLGLEKSSAQLMPKGSVLFSSRAPIGYTAIAAKPLSTNQGFKSIVPYNMDMSKYIYWVLNAIVPRIVGKANGTTFKEISGQELAQEIVPLPPLEEQKRIVEKLEKLLPLCDKLI